MDPTTWVLDQIVGLFPGGGYNRGAAVPSLQGVIDTLEGRSGGLVFGMVLSALDMARAPQIIALARDAIAAWG
jgi:hypothetical protein